MSRERTEIEREMDERAQQQRRWMRITAIVAPYILWVGIAGGFTAAIGVPGGMRGTSYNQAFQGARNSGRGPASRSKVTLRRCGMDRDR